MDTNTKPGQSTNIPLPEEFCQKMKQLFGEEAPAFFQSYEAEKSYGLRLNQLRYSGGKPPEFFPFHLSQIAWTKEGYYASAKEHPGRHLLHEAGAYYIQEPSAMSVVSLLSPLPGEKICDLCAAPGGKSTQIAANMSGEGLLLSNEISTSRAKVLSGNLERFGVTNSFVCHESPDDLSGRFPDFFDKILVDAPCSGEGMFRKDINARKEWSPAQVAVCAERQKKILEHADKMLKPGGVLVYSTCTFSKEENEDMMDWFLKTHPLYKPDDWKQFFPNHTGISDGFGFPESMRLLPHHLRGEGHFATRLIKAPSSSSSVQTAQKKKKNKKSPFCKAPAEYLSFLKEHFLKTDSPLTNRLFSGSGHYQMFGNELYLVPPEIKDTEGLKITSAGLHLGTLKKNRFEPAHALAKSAFVKDVTACKICDGPNALRYLKGEPLSCSHNQKGWILICHENLSLGWGKAANGIIKNHYPKGLRINY